MFLFTQTIDLYYEEMRNHDYKDVSVYLPPRLLFNALKSHGLGFSSSFSQDIWKLREGEKNISLNHASRRQYESSDYFSKI